MDAKQLVDAATTITSTAEAPALTQEPPVVALPSVAAYPGARTPVAIETESIAPPNIFAATLRALVLPFRSELFRETLRLTPSWGGSMLAHMLVVLGLALYMHQELRSTDPRTLELTIHEAAGAGEPEEFNEAELPPVQASLQPVVLAAESAPPVTVVGDFLANPEVPLAINEETSAATLLDMLADPRKLRRKAVLQVPASTNAAKERLNCSTTKLHSLGSKARARSFASS